MSPPRGGPDFATLLRNVLGNAVKYSQPHGVVTVCAYRDGNDAVLSVEDEGPGIAPAQLERVFEPFYRVPGVRESGTGLGLAIVAAMTKRLGGKATLLPGNARTGMRFEYRQPLVAAGGALAPRA